MKNKTFLITGAQGQLGSEFQKILIEQGLNCVAPKESELSITDVDNLKKQIKNIKPDFIINCAAYNAVDDAEDNSDLAYLINNTSVNRLAEICRDLNIFFVHYGSDYVFDGKKQDLYNEKDDTNPLNIYGDSKLKGEQAVIKILENSLVLRLSWVFGHGKQNFLYKLSTWAEKNKVLKISSDEVSVPTYTKDIVNLTIMSLKMGLTGLFHLVNSGYASRYELAKYFISKMELDNLVIPVPMANFNSKAKRPGFSAMSNKNLSDELNFSIPLWQKGVDEIAHFFKS